MNDSENKTLPIQRSRSTAGLERCPFCGGEAAFSTTTYNKKTIREQCWGQDTFHSVNCISCGTNNRGLVGYLTPEKAAAHWNKRSNVK
jgi:hypothetical protein